jgi:hypothetical protein
MLGCSPAQVNEAIWLVVHQFDLPAPFILGPICGMLEPVKKRTTKRPVKRKAKIPRNLDVNQLAKRLIETTIQTSESTKT